jgi:hypothetical protein
MKRPIGRPVKDYWNWNKLEFQYTGWKDKPWAEVEQYLYGHQSPYYEIREETEWPTPRTRWSHKQTSRKHYWIKDPVVASWVALKLS